MLRGGVLLAPWAGHFVLRRWLALIGVAGSFTLLDAVKPLHVDDTYYYFHARQAASHPFDPHGFMVFWHERPEPASNRVAPPVLPYWLAPFVRAFPEGPYVWKLSLLPFAVAFVGALFALLRRFASGLEWPLLLLTVASPAVLPSFNLMLDIPAVGLGMLALVLFMRSGEAFGDLRFGPRRRWAAGALWASGAGLLAGLSAQTKYTGLLVPAVLLAHALVYRRLRVWLVATAVAVTVFVGWELFTAIRYSESHFVRHVFRRAEPLDSKLPLVIAFCSVFGGAAPGLASFGLLARGAHARATAFGIGATLLGFVLLALLPGPDPEAAATLILGMLGAALVASLLWASRRLWSEDPGAEARASRFLVLWLAIEAVGHLGLSPFPAVRRVLGLVVVATLVIGRVASRACRGQRRRLAWKAATAGASLGALFWTVDFLEASAEKRAVLDTVSWLHQRAGPTFERVFFAGHWGFQFYAERAGMRPVVAGRFAGATPLRAGDWLVVPSPHVDQQRIRLESAALQAVHDLRISDPLPLTTLPGFYTGETPLHRLTGPRVEVTVYRVKRDFLP